MSLIALIDLFYIPWTICLMPQLTELYIWCMYSVCMQMHIGILYTQIDIVVKLNLLVAKHFG